MWRRSAAVITVAAALGGFVVLDYLSRDVAQDLAPFWVTPMHVVDKMLEMAKVTSNDIVYDLGCGDGRIVIAAATRKGARGVGVEYDPEVAKRAIENVQKQNLEGRVQIIIGDAMKTEIAPATVVMIYLLEDSNRKMRPILERSLKAGTRIVTHEFPVPGWTAERTEQWEDGTGRVRKIFLYRIAS